MPPPRGCYYTTVPPGSIALTIAGMALLYWDGTYYKTTYVEGATQYQVVAPPAGASLPAGTVLPADRATITIAGVTYYVYGNTFYKPMRAGRTSRPCTHGPWPSGGSVLGARRTPVGWFKVEGVLDEDVTL